MALIQHSCAFLLLPLNFEQKSKKIDESEKEKQMENTYVSTDQIPKSPHKSCPLFQMMSKSNLLQGNQVKLR